MRRFIVVPLAGLLLLGAAAPAFAGANVSNTSGSGESIYGEWYGDGMSGSVFLGEENGTTGFGEIYQESGEYIECTAPVGPAPAVKSTSVTPDDTGGGDYGFKGTRTWGYSENLTIDLSKKLEHGTATGSVELYTAAIDECAGIYGDEAVEETATLRVEVSAAGPLATFRDHGSYQIPSEFNGHSNYRGSERAASGSVVAGSSIDTQLSFGYMSKVTWTEHVNG